MRLTLPTRPKGEMVEAEYEPHEIGEMVALSARADEFPVGSPERIEALRSMCAIHELKVLLGARMLTEHDLRERKLSPPAEVHRLVRQRVEQPDEDGAIQTTMLAPEGTSSHFQIPPKARRRLGMVEGDNTATGERKDHPPTEEAAVAPF